MSRHERSLVPGAWSKVRPWSLVRPWSVVLGATLALTVAVAAQSSGPGRPATPEEIRNLGAAIAPDGGGLPEGSGTVAAGRDVFMARCSRCHGDKAQGDVGPA